MKKEYWIGLIIVLILGAGYLFSHRSPAPTSPGAVAAQINNDIVMTKTDTAKGNFLTDPSGMTVYIFDKDTANVSNCYTTCAKAWPPYLQKTASASTMPADFSTTKRTDGTMQYTYKGRPLYYYEKDKKAGDIIGDGVGDVWHLVKP